MGPLSQREGGLFRFRSKKSRDPTTSEGPLSVRDDKKSEEPTETTRRGFLEVGAFLSVAGRGQASAVELDPLTRELLDRTDKNRASNSAASLNRNGLGRVPFGSIGEAPGVDTARKPGRSDQTSTDSDTADETYFASAQISPASSGTSFHSNAFGLEEYNNVFAASDNTNVSPKEAYDTILSKVSPTELTTATEAAGRPLRALDLGAGAGVSTEMLWRLGYRELVAVDWSDAAWTRFVSPASVPRSVTFMALDDQRWLGTWQAHAAAGGGFEHGEDGRFDAIVFNYAVSVQIGRVAGRRFMILRGRCTMQLFVKINQAKSLHHFAPFNPSNSILICFAKRGTFSRSMRERPLTMHARSSARAVDC